VKRKGDWVQVTPLDSLRMRVYIAPRGLWLTLDAGRFEAVEVNAKTGAVRVGLASATAETPQARLRIEQPAQITGVGSYRLREQFEQEREAYVIPLKQGATWIELNSPR
jgi:hypothetical protein